MVGIALKSGDLNGGGLQRLEFDKEEVSGIASKSGDLNGGRDLCGTIYNTTV